STVLYPSDGTSTAALVEQMTKTSGVSYLRTTRGAYPVLYGADEQFPVGGSKTLRSSEDDAVTLIGAGVTLHEALTAADSLAEQATLGGWRRHPGRCRGQAARGAHGGRRPRGAGRHGSCHRRVLEPADRRRRQP